jgi:hypothetical protein
MKTIDQSPESNDSQSLKCAHPSCRCQVPPDRPFGRYCGQHCQDAGEINELRCECGHDMCR